jgi:hypothetical protein
MIASGSRRIRGSMVSWIIVMFLSHQLKEGTYIRKTKINNSGMKNYIDDEYIMVFATAQATV